MNIREYISYIISTTMPATATSRKIPRPKAYDLLMGNINQLRTERLLFLRDQQKELGDIFELRIPGRKLIVCTDPEAIKHVLVDNNKNYTKSFAYDSIRLFLGNGLLTSEGEFWKKQRRLAQPAFHKQKLDLMFRNMVEQTQTSVAHLEQYADSGQPVNLGKELYALTLNIVNNTLFYNEIDSTTDRIYNLVSQGSEIISERIDNPFRLPLWIPTPRNRHEQKVLHEMDDIFFGIFRRRRHNAVEHMDLLSMLMDARDEDTGETMSDRQLRDEILTIFVAGHETTQIALGWTFYLLSQNPEKMAILQQEIDTVLKGEIPTPESVRQMPYLKLVIDESMRVFPPAWIMGRKSIEADELCGYPIEPGTNVVMPIYVVHHDERVWENAEAFIPERFRPENLKEKHKYSYFPFGGGPRLCIGNNFAIQEMQVVLCMFLQRFRIGIDPAFMPELDPLVTLRAKNPIYAKVWKRSA